MKKVAESISRVGIGGWQVGETGWGWEKQYSRSDVMEAFAKGFELGINFIDTSEDYGVSEKIIGEIVKKSGRDDLFVATKVNKNHLHRDDLFKACDASRRTLGLDAIDLYQIHDPSPHIPLRETMRAFEALVNQGKIRYIGVSNFPVSLLKEAQSCLSKAEIVSNQIRYNLVQREAEEEIIPYCKKENIAVIAYSPLAKGLLTGKYGPGRRPQDGLRGTGKQPLFEEENLTRLTPLLEKLQALSKKYGRSESQVSLNWLLSDDDVYPIFGAKSAAQVEDNAASMCWQLRREDCEALRRIVGGINLTYYSTAVTW